MNFRGEASGPPEAVAMQDAGARGSRIDTSGEASRIPLSLPTIPAQRKDLRANSFDAKSFPQISESRRGPGTLPPAASIPPVLDRLQRADLPPEIAFLRGSVPDTLLAAAAKRATRLGVGADRVLIAGGAISEQAYLRRFSAFFGCRVIDLDTVPRGACPLGGDRLIQSLAAGILPLQTPDGLIVVQAPQERGSARLARLALSDAPIGDRFVLTTRESVARFVHRYTDERLAHQAADALHCGEPQFSAAPQPRRRSYWALAAMALLLAAGISVSMPSLASLAAQALLSLTFIACVALRLGGALICPRAGNAPLVTGRRVALPAQPPTYTVIAALYHEADAVEDLVHSLSQLDYPPEKLDIKIVIEADDRETKAALARLRLAPPFEIVVAPPGGPRTKPRALNTALPFARGTYLVIYDAEDRPERDQLCRAVAAFAQNPDIVCMQAHLTIDNTDDGCLSRLFTAEYAAHFDVFLPGLASLGLPLPLGGSSNHFHTATLRLAGGWDSYNVTEDADLGMRLSRLGLRCGVFSSSTYEEAPAKLRPWLRQRTRWFKGWIQTWTVHMRAPRSLRKQMGPCGFWVFQLLTAGSVLSALVYPLLIGDTLHRLYIGRPEADPLAVLQSLITMTTMVFGFGGSALMWLCGLRKRRLNRLAWIIVLIPLHWLLLSLAAWRAVYQFLFDRYRWEKTRHGVARTSRRAAAEHAGSKHG